MLAIFFDIKGIVHKKFVQAGQTVNSAYYWDFYGDWMKTSPRTLAMKELADAAQLTVSHIFFHKGTKNNMPVASHPPYFSLLSRLKKKLTGLQYDTIEVIEAD
jgi:hypothetical protein